jgi:aryl-alcohol dehydrogenase-like predicted oxidoreductase
MYTNSPTGKIALGSENATVDIVLRAFAAGITHFDSACVYLGEPNLRDLPPTAKIVTKFPPNLSIMDSYKKSCLNLGRESFYGLLAHKASDYCPENLPTLRMLRAQHKVMKIGCSIYTQDEIPPYPLDIIQLPINILDQRFVKEIQRLKKRNVEVWGRSVLLKGVLMKDPDSLPDFFDPIKGKLRKLPKDPMARLSLCVNFVKNVGVDVIILAFDDEPQINQAIGCLDGVAGGDYSDLATTECINPRVWPK